MRIADKQKIESGLQVLKSIDWRTIRISSIRKRLPEPFKEIPLIIGDTPKLKYVYRARTLISFGTNESIDRINALSYPPKTKIKWLGRANLKYDPVFYCARNLVTAIAEVGPFEKVHIVGKWKVKDQIIPMVAQFIESVEDLDVIKFKTDLINNNFPTANIEDKENIIWLNKILEDEYLKDVRSECNYQYKFSAFWSNLSLKLLNGISYPSAKIVNSVNFALNTRYVDENLILEKAYMLSHIDRGNSVERILLSVGKNFDNTIKWASPNKEDLLVFNREDHVPYHISLKQKPNP